MTRNLSRRTFLLGAATAGGAAAAAAVLSGKSVSEATQGAPRRRATRGYQASEHVNNYYRTTKV